MTRKTIILFFPNHKKKKKKKKKKKGEKMSEFGASEYDRDAVDYSTVRYVPKAANIPISIDWRTLDRAVNEADKYFLNFVQAYPYFQKFLNWYAQVSRMQRNLTYSQLSESFHRGGIVAIETGLLYAFHITENLIARTNPQRLPYSWMQEKSMLGCMTATTASLHHLVKIAYEHGGRLSEGLKRLRDTLSDECLRLGQYSLRARAQAQAQMESGSAKRSDLAESRFDLDDDDEFDREDEKYDDKFYSSAFSFPN